MSLLWLILRSGTIGGVAAFVGWCISEYVYLRYGLDSAIFGEPVTCAIVGSAIGIGMSLAADFRGLPSARPGRVMAGIVAGGFAGAIGMSLGHACLGILPGSRTLGWALMGGGIGTAEGLYERSAHKLRQGAVAASIGGLAGGLLFGTVYSGLSTVSEPASRAIGFLLFGTGVGVLIGLAKLAFAEAWLTVVSGQHAGRKLALSSPSIVLGKARWTAFPFTTQDNTEVDSEHVRIVRQPDGRFALEDLQSRHGTFINSKRVSDQAILEDGDLIRIGTNSMRFNTRKWLQKSHVATQESIPPLVRDTRVPSQPEGRGGRVISEPPVSKSSPSAPPRTAGRRPSGMSLCPQCRRPVPGTRPYCVICKLSF